MAPDTQQSPAKQQSPRPSAQTRAHPRTLAQDLSEAERLRDHALATLRADAHHGRLLLGWGRDGARAVIGLALRHDGPSLGAVRATVLRLRRLPCVVPGGAAGRTRGAPAVPLREAPARAPGLLLSALHPQGTRRWGSPLASQGGQAVVGPSPACAGRTLDRAVPNALEEEPQP